LTPEQLEELRLLSNADMDSSSPFAGILIGQPTLSTRLRQGIFAAYVAHRPMSRQEPHSRSLTAEFHLIAT
jgi:type II secretory pathway predicted ATPase ExeA